MATLLVNGIGTVEAPPNYAFLDLNIVVNSDDKVRAKGDADICIKDCTEFLESCYIHKEDIKLTAYENYRTSHSERHTEHGVEHTVTVYDGYQHRARLWVKVMFPKDTDGNCDIKAAMNKISDIIYAVCSIPFARISLSSYKTDLSSKYRKEAIEKAVADARDTATIIADAAGEELVSINQIRYGWNEVRVSSNNGMYRQEANMYASKSSAISDLTPTNIPFSETVTVEFETQPKK